MVTLRNWGAVTPFYLKLFQRNSILCGQLFCAMAVLLLAPNLALAEMRVVKAFVGKHCIRCHGATTQENDKRFDKLPLELKTVEAIEGWQEVLDQLNLGEMPPTDEPQPAADELASTIRQLTNNLQTAYAQQRSTGGETVARRLNRFELRNTVRDLLYINNPELRIGNVPRLVDNNGNGRVENTSTDPFRAFPGDEVEEGFDNIGNRLVMSDFLLKLMLDAAEESIAMATVAGPAPNVSTRRFAALIAKQARNELERVGRELNPQYDSMYQRGMLVPDPIRGGVGTSLRYRITVEASGYNQQHPWGESLPTTQTDPFQFTLRLFKNRSRNDFIPVGQFQLPGDGKQRQFSFECWIDRNWFPQLIWENGPSDREVRTELLMQKHLPHAFKPAPDRKVITDKDAYNKARASWSKEMAKTLIQNYRGPHVRVHSIVLEPLLDEWPPRSHSALFGDGELSAGQVAPLLQKFAERAYRRPVAAEEIEPFIELVKSQLAPQVETPRMIDDLKFQMFEGKWTKLPDFSKLKPDREGELPGGEVDIRIANRPEFYGLVFTGKLILAQDGEYQFRLASDDGSRLFVDGQKLIDHDGLHGASTREGKVKLKQGAHSLRLEYFAYGQPNSLKLSYSGPGFVDKMLSATMNSPQQLANVDTQTAERMRAIQVGYTAILCSPDFLYLQEQPGRLRDYEIASRLSYFLWSSMPDDRLFSLAAAGKLTEKATVNAEVERMLADPKAAAFTHHFTERWLRLDKLAESPPELNGPFRIYWDRKMEPQIVAQTNAYFAHLLERNGPIRELIDSDYTFLNESIADVFYGRKDIKGDYLRKVATNNPRRGGVLTQPSVLTATANGVDTSPVVRGVWVLENILGTPPSPPPPDVEPLSPDLRNAKTIREQLEVHRKQEACSSCHRKIDPLGFAFENYDPIGRWREQYPKGRGKVDPSTTLSNGNEVADIVAFKQVLLARERDVTRCLTKKLLSYASGRLLEPLDRGEVERIVDELERRQGGLRDLVKLVASSDIVLTK